MLECIKSAARDLPFDSFRRSLQFFRSSNAIVTGSCTLALFADGFLYGILVPINPFILNSQAGLDENDVEKWNTILLSAYGASALLSSPLIGWLADRHCMHRRLFAVSALMSSLSIVILYAGRSIMTFMLSRICHGIFSSGAWTTGLAVLSRKVSTNTRGRAIGTCATGFSTAVLVAPITGGWLLATYGFKSVLAVTLAFTISDFFLRLFISEEKPVQRTDPQHRYWTISTTDTGIPCISPVAPVQVFEAYIVQRQCSETPSTHEKQRSITAIFRHRQFLFIMAANFVNMLTQTSFDAVLPIQIHQSFGWSSVGTGLVFFPLLLPNVLGPYIGKLSDKYGPRKILILGFCIATPALVSLRVVKTPQTVQIVLLCLLLSLIGFSNALIITPVIVEITNVVSQGNAPDREFGEPYAQAYGIYFLVVAAATLVGPLLSGFIHHAAGWSATTLFLGVANGIVAVALVAQIWLSSGVKKCPRTAV